MLKVIGTLSAGGQRGLEAMIFGLGLVPCGLVLMQYWPLLRKIVLVAS